MGVEADEAGDQVLDMGQRARKSGGDVGFMGQMAQQAGMMLASYISMKGLHAAWSLGELGASAIDTETGFEALMSSAGQTGDTLDRLRTSSKGTISDLQLMQASNTALIGSTGEFGQEMAGALPRLIEWARISSMLNPALGDTARLYDRLTLGIKRRSPMVVDDTGLTLRLGEANARMAEQVGKSTDELTAQEQSLAFLRETLRAIDVAMAELPEGMEAATASYQEMTAQTLNLRSELGRLANIVTGPLASGAAEMVGYYADVLEVEREAGRATLEFNVELAKMAATGEMAIGVAADLTLASNRLYQQMKAGEIDLGEFNAGLEEMKIRAELAEPALEGIGGAMQRLSIGAEPWTRLLQETVIPQQQLIQSTGELRDKVEELGKAQLIGQEDADKYLLALQAVEELQAQGAISAADAALAVQQLNDELGSIPGLAAKRALEQAAEGLDTLAHKYRDLLEDMAPSGVMAGIRWRKQVVAGWEAYADQWEGIASKVSDSVDELHRETVRKSEEAAREATAAWEREWSQLTSDISGLMVPSMRFDAEAWFDSMGMHVDTWDEWLRRSIDVVNLGEGSPWFNELVSKFPSFRKILEATGDPRVAAAEWTRRFQLGLIPEAVDRETIKQRYIEMITGRQSMAQLVNEIAAELSGMGIQVEMPVLQQALGGPQAGLGAGGDMAVSMATGFSTGIPKQQFAPVIATTLNAQIKANAPSFASAGEDIAGIVAVGFEEAMKEEDFFGPLVDALWPPLKERFYREGWRTD